MAQRRPMNKATSSVAVLSSVPDYTIFSYGGQVIRFAAPYSLRRYVRVKKWHDGYLEVGADYGEGEEEDYIDLKTILKSLLINPRSFLRPIKRVEVRYAK